MKLITDGFDRETASPSLEGEFFSGEDAVGVISRIEEEKTGRGMKYRLFLDEVPFCTLKRRELKASGIKEGDILTEGKRSELIRGPLFQRGKAYSLHLLDSRPMTREQVRKKLTEHSYPEECAELILRDLTDSGILNDREYALSYCLSYLGRESAGRIRSKLKTRGVSTEEIEEAFSSCNRMLADSEDTDLVGQKEQDALMKAFDRYSKKADLSDRKERESLIRKLLYRGFRYSEIRSCMERKMQGSSEEETDFETFP